MADKTPAGLTNLITRPASRTAVGHFQDDANSRETSIEAIVEWGLIAEWIFTINVPQVDFTDLDHYSELLILSQAVTKSVSGVLSLRVSSDNGSSFYSASGDYATISTAGARTNTTSISMHTTNATAARDSICHIPAFNLDARKPVITPTASTVAQLITQALGMNAIRVFPSAGGNLTAGAIYLFGR